MSACEKTEKCPFFNDKMASMPGVAALMKNNFCKQNKEACARYMVATSGKMVPADLFPNHFDRARELTAQQ